MFELILAACVALAPAQRRPAAERYVMTVCFTLNIPERQSGSAQDGDIRVVYDKDQRLTNVTLTLLPRSADGKPTPTGMQLTLTAQFPDRAAKTRPKQIEVRAYSGLMWAPRLG